MEGPGQPKSRRVSKSVHCETTCGDAKCAQVGYIRGLSAMVEASKQPLTVSPLRDVLPAAAVWIVHARKEHKSSDLP